MTSANTPAARLEALLKACDRKGRILILTQNNPDPDAIGSAAALREIISKRLHKRASIRYGGVCGRAENRAMMHVLHIDAKPLSAADIKKFKIVCLVDTQPLSGNNVLPDSRQADVVIDHHLLPKKVHWNAAYSDVRPDYGAAATMVYEYVRAAKLKLDARLATALFYGIQSDTQDLGREASAADVEAFQELFFLADKKKLAQIRRAPVPPDYFHQLHDALQRCIVAGSAVITSLEGDNDTDVYAEIADMLLRLEHSRTSVSFGRSGESIYISARSVDGRSNTADRMRRVVKGIGAGGGHRTMAGGQVPCDGDDFDERIAEVHKRVVRHFARNADARPLLPNSVAAYTLLGDHP